MAYGAVGSSEHLTEATWTIGAAIFAQTGSQIGGVLGELMQYAGVGGAAVAALFILRKAYKQRNDVQNKTIESLKEEIERLRDELRGKT